MQNVDEVLDEEVASIRITSSKGKAKCNSKKEKAKKNEKTKEIPKENIKEGKKSKNAVTTLVTRKKGSETKQKPVSSSSSFTDSEAESLQSSKLMNKEKGSKSLSKKVSASVGKTRIHDNNNDKTSAKHPKVKKVSKSAIKSNGKKKKDESDTETEDSDSSSETSESENESNLPPNKSIIKTKLAKKKDKGVSTKKLQATKKLVNEKKKDSTVSSTKKVDKSDSSSSETTLSENDGSQSISKKGRDRVAKKGKLSENSQTSKIVADNKQSTKSIKPTNESVEANNKNEKQSNASTSNNISATLAVSKQFLNRANGKMATKSVNKDSESGSESSSSSDSESESDSRSTVVEAVSDGKSSSQTTGGKTALGSDKSQKLALSPVSSSSTIITNINEKSTGSVSYSQTPLSSTSSASNARGKKFVKKSFTKSSSGHVRFSSSSDSDDYFSASIENGDSGESAQNGNCKELTESANVKQSEQELASNVNGVHSSQGSVSQHDGQSQSGSVTVKMSKNNGQWNIKSAQNQTKCNGANNEEDELTIDENCPTPNSESSVTGLSKIQKKLQSLAVIKPVLPPKDYTGYPALVGPPRTGDIIAYKVLEISSSYTPEVSAYKEGEVVNINHSTSMLDVRLSDASMALGPSREGGRFELEDQEGSPVHTNSNGNDVQPPDRLVSVMLNSLIEPKLVT